MTPVVRPTRLADLRVSPPVFAPATITRHFPAARLAAVEAAWEPARRALAAALAAAGMPSEHSHWDWRNKFGRAGLVLYAVECEGEVQGLMAVEARPRPAVLTPGESVLYVDYLESAPWNLKAPGHPKRFGTVGTALLLDAIAVSLDAGLGGRIGLHSLDQAAGFYKSGCQMTGFGKDPGYYDLEYFE